MIHYQRVYASYPNYVPMISIPNMIPMILPISLTRHSAMSGFIQCISGRLLTTHLLTLVVDLRHHDQHLLTLGYLGVHQGTMVLTHS